MVRLVAPCPELLDAYADALARGWSPHTERDISREQLALIRRDRAGFLRDLCDPTRMLRTTAGKTVPRLPGSAFWILDQDFCGAINFRHLIGTDDLPDHVSGHIGYTIVAWRRGAGRATAALRLVLPVARAAGLARVMITCDVDNHASRRVIEKVGGVRTSDGPPLAPGLPIKMRFWVDLGD
ncbi:MAG: GNAT family N-acetyltransferase [Alphaproteobacteria bacterium]|nr:GNAT family N-acetyltransferase [Alphaproteobacteria bacterium]